MPAAVPTWPALMAPETAAAYCDMGESTFLVFAARHGIRPVATGHRLRRYRRADIDACLDSLPAADASLPPMQQAPSVTGPPVDLAEAAASALERRLAARR